MLISMSKTKNLLIATVLVVVSTSNAFADVTTTTKTTKGKQDFINICDKYIVNKKTIERVENMNGSGVKVIFTDKKEEILHFETEKDVKACYSSVAKQI